MKNEENIAKSIFKNGFKGQSPLKVSDYQVPVIGLIKEMFMVRLI